MLANQDALVPERLAYSFIRRLNYMYHKCGEATILLVKGGITMRLFGICEDELAHRERLVRLIQAWATQNNEAIQFMYFDSGSQFEWIWEDELPFDALFFDISLSDDITGLQLAEMVRKRNRDIPIIMVTNHMELVIGSFHLRLTDYLVKPITPDTLFPLLNRLRDTLNERPSSLFRFIRVDRSDGAVPYSEILYFMSNNHDIEIVTSTPNICPNPRFRATMQDVLDKLKSNRRDDFCRVHRSYIVNMMFINLVTGSTITFLGKNTHPINIGQQYDSSFNAAYSRFTRHFKL